MARTYSTRLIALAIRTSPKWVDNLLSHFDLPGVVRSRQGIERRISDEGLLAIEVSRLLTSELGLALAQAAALAREALEARTSDTMRVTRGDISLSFARLEIEQRLRDRMIDAVEAVARVPRGRPRGTLSIERDRK